MVSCYNDLFDVPTAWEKGGETFGVFTGQSFTQQTAFRAERRRKGTGCLVKAVETAAQREAFIVGKPNRFMFDCVASEFEVDPARTIMVGDRLDTDILMGNSCGLTTLLTLTGVTALDEVRAHLDSECPARRSLVPDYYVDSIADLLPALGQ
ncbi:phosphoglycolate phosphatase [Willisornis vidua]|uniref:Phosphoglycolate phosphatase n=1 Tax=Willisornis vidua TaxID=1566151 RepID=A0ABQ9DEK5_9PASS|nr:phosphoglycolate phosphatase [Willisornis vidua]